MSIRRWASKALFQLAGAIAPPPAPAAYTLIRLDPAKPAPKPERKPKHPLEHLEDMVMADIRAVRKARRHSCKHMSFNAAADALSVVVRNRTFPDEYWTYWRHHQRVLQFAPSLYAWFRDSDSGEIAELLNACIARFDAEG